MSTFKQEDSPEFWHSSDSRFFERGPNPENWLPYDPRFVDMARQRLWSNRPSLIDDFLAIVWGRDWNRLRHKESTVLLVVVATGWFYSGLAHLVWPGFNVGHANLLIYGTIFCWILWRVGSRRNQLNRSIHFGSREVVAVKYLVAFSVNSDYLNASSATWCAVDSAMYVIARNSSS